jgi:hypothetical protein
MRKSDRKAIRTFVHEYGVVDVLDAICEDLDDEGSKVLARAANKLDKLDVGLEKNPVDLDEPEEPDDEDSEDDELDEDESLEEVE